MALITCPECKSKISSYASYCVNCGCPMEKIKMLMTQQVNNIIKQNRKTDKTNKKGEYVL